MAGGPVVVGSSERANLRYTIRSRGTADGVPGT